MCQNADCSGECLSPRSYSADTCFSLHGTVLTETVLCHSNASSSCAKLNIYALSDKLCSMTPVSTLQIVCEACFSSSDVPGGTHRLACGSQQWTFDSNCSSTTAGGECSCTVKSPVASSCSLVPGVGNVLIDEVSPCAETVEVSLFERIYCQGAGEVSVMPNGGCLQGTRYLCTP